MVNDFLEKVGEKEWRFVCPIRNQKLVKQIVNKEIDLFPKSFDFTNHRLEWGWIENRPFLQVCQSIAFDFFCKRKYF
jgi:hypothetical protein